MISNNYRPFFGEKSLNKWIRNNSKNKELLSNHHDNGTENEQNTDCSARALYILKNFFVDCCKTEK